MGNVIGYKQDRDGLYIDKSPTAVLDYSLNWSDWLGTDTINTSSHTVSTISGDGSPLTKDSESRTSTQTTVNLSGGTVGNIYTVTCSVTTASSKTEARSFRVVVKNRSA